DTAKQLEGQPRQSRPASCGGDRALSAASKRKSGREQTTLEFPDNGLLASLSGAHQRNFVRLEQKLGVRVATRGNLVAIEGPQDSRARAVSVLRALYARLETGEMAGPEEIDAEIRFVAEGSAKVLSGEFGSPTVKTATSRITRARSPAQAAYL